MISKFFIDRPVFATVLSILITLGGLVSIFTLPIARFPEIVPPSVQLKTSYQGANAETVAQSVAGPIEQQLYEVVRGPDFDPANHNWEYFELNVSANGTDIRKRGRDEIINMFGGQCFGCHEAARDFDFICEENHGCVKLPVSGEVIARLQDADPRCSAK